MIILFFQILLNTILYKILNDKFLKLYKVIALIFFPLLFIVIPLIGFLLALRELEGSPDAVAVSYSPIFFEEEYLIMIFLSVGIQILFTLFGNKIFRKKEAR
jgi:hypothetical protein